ncbi:MAG: bifunctional riboflavin kinase/FAD synthetase [Lachnospiraceae bacterium]
MNIISNTKQFQLHHTSVVLGKFESLHLGHQMLLEKLNDTREYLRVMFTFYEYPNQTLNHERFFLCTKEERYERLERYLDTLIEYPFNDATRTMEPERFLEEILINQLDCKRLIVGEDFHFGYQRQGDVTFLRNMQKKYGYELCVLSKRKFDGKVISSSRVKEFLKKGHMEEVTKLLGRPYSFEGTVVLGNQLGRTFQVPTANMNPPAGKLLPPNGVYISRTNVDGNIYPSVTNIGSKPTVNDNRQVNIETNLLGFDDNLYGKKIKVELYHNTRKESHYPSVDALIRQLHQDVEDARVYWKLNIEKEK